MCGLVSIILKDNNKVFGKDYIEVFKQMLYADALRGWDSTGICVIKGNNKATVYKDNTAAGVFLYRLDDNKWAYGNRALIGHNRWATRGSVTAENAHPFEEGQIILAHNGTLRAHHALKNVAVDSHAITHSMNEIGAEKTLEKLDGAFALIWYDKETGEINATRNKERPLFIVDSDDFYIIISEAELARWIMARNGFKHVKTTSCVPGTLYTFSENKKNQISIDTTKYKLYSPPPYVPPVHVNPNFSQQGALQLPKPDTPQTMTPTGQTPTTNVTSIRPSKAGSGTDVAIGDVLDVLFYKMKHTKWDNYNLGRIQWEAGPLDTHDIHLEVYTHDTTDYSEMAGTVTVSRVYYSAHLLKFVVIATNPEVKKSMVADETGPSITSNGTKVTNEVLKLVEDKNCAFCSAPFAELDEEEFPQIVLTPKIVQNHLYTYTYYCPKCADYFHLSKRKQA